MRSAEKSRIATCAFADRVGSLCINTFNRITPTHVHDNIQQTVLACVVLRVNHTLFMNTLTVESDKSIVTCHVVAIGSGTKYLSTSLIELDELHHTRVTDMHAEVLGIYTILTILTTYLYNTYIHVLVCS